MTVLYSERESVGTKAQFVTLTQQTDDNRQVVIGSDRPLNVIDVNHQRLHEGAGLQRIQHSHTRKYVACW